MRARKGGRKVKRPRPVPIQEQLDRITTQAMKPYFAITLARRPKWKQFIEGGVVAAALLVPLPNLQLQTCDARFDGAVMEIRCDSTKVCPPGYHLDTHINSFKGGRDLSGLFGYGDVKNTCALGAIVHQPNQVMEVLP